MRQSSGRLKFCLLLYKGGCVELGFKLTAGLVYIADAGDLMTGVWVLPLVGVEGENAVCGLNLGKATGIDQSVTPHIIRYYRQVILLPKLR